MSRTHLELSFLGTFQAVRGGEPLVGLRSDKVRALLAYLAVEANRAHRRDSLAALLWGDSDDQDARASLRVSLSNLKKTLDAPPTTGDAASILTITRQSVEFHAGAHTGNSRPNRNAVWVDVHVFNDYLDACHRHLHQDLTRCFACISRLGKAVALYKGEFLAGFVLAGSSDFGEWRLVVQERLHRRALTALDVLTAHHLACEEYEQALMYGRQQVALTPWREQAHRQLMLAFVGNGERARALEQYQQCRDVLADELGVEPSLETKQLYTRIQSNSRKENKTQAGSLTAHHGQHAMHRENRSLTGSQHPRLVPMHNLPAQVTPLIGRETELAELERRLSDSFSRLVTIVGPGGVGKTRLALAVAERVLDLFPDGVYIVPFLGIAEEKSSHAAASLHNFVATAIIAALNVPFHTLAAPRDQLLHFLRNKRALFLLDSLEQLADGDHLAELGRLIADLLRHAPGIRLLVTSRQRLSLQAESLVPLEGLSLPAPFDSTPIQSAPSVQLFVERARRTLRSFAPTEDELAAVVEICRIAGGLPLSIELAATWVAHYTCAEIAHLMQSDLDFLTTPMADLPPRHRSVRAVLEQSWYLLSGQEQRILAQASIFQGSFSRSAAVEITDATVGELASLVDKSLLHCTAPGRYELHELLRQFAAEKWLELAADCRSPHTATTGPARSRPLAERHAKYYLGLVAGREASLNSLHSRRIVKEIRQEMGNIRQAWLRAATHGWTEPLAESVQGLSRFYAFTGLLQEAEAIFREAISRIATAPSPLSSIDQSADRGQSLRRLHSILFCELAAFLNKQGKFDTAIQIAHEALEEAKNTAEMEIQATAHTHMGYAHWRRGDLGNAEKHLQIAFKLAQEASLSHLEPLVLSRFGALLLLRGHYRQGSEHFDTYLRFCQKTGDCEGEGIAYNNLGYAYHAQCNYERARYYFERSLAIKREMDARQGEGNTAVNLGVIYLTLGDYEQAEACYRSALEIGREIGDRRLEGLALSNLSLLSHRQANHPQAERRARQALEILEEIGDRPTLGYPLTHLGHALVGLGALDAAESVYKEAIALRRKLGQEHTMVESLAGLATVHLARGEVKTAQSLIQPLLGKLDGRSLEGTLEPSWIYLTCYRVLQANGDPRAHEILTAAQRFLQETSGRFEDETLRRSFLESVPHHRELLSTV